MAEQTVQSVERCFALLEQLAALRQKAREDILRQVTACWQAR